MAEKHDRSAHLANEKTQLPQNPAVKVVDAYQKHKGKVVVETNLTPENLQRFEIKLANELFILVNN
ncbi:MAG: hypothetical protein WA061_03180 [Microgenomates group bacterium]